ncbi:pilus assembly protein CpaB [Vibrio sp. JPW-9-11-11]|uniref:pilus assembly protein CpaB n=1 Tax=Vibrio sp. JPW-9-11-11 TaxID=1416532 RepID=UPI001594C619|nr:pilus assembly protein CpaB [Vibrio sp. JPW-9-11-11]NVD07820.1 pilus assembly protein CpaB [Vibrio sp. JPW-9-11-11]
MNRIFVILLIALSIFSTMYFFGGEYFNEQDEPKAIKVDEEPSVYVSVLGLDVAKGTFLSEELYQNKLVKASELAGYNYTESGALHIEPGALLRKDLVTGSYLNQDDISNPGDRDYMFLSMNDGELPYFYHVSGVGIVQTQSLFAGDKVSFVSTTSSESNLLENGYEDIGGLTSRVIISGARVLQVIDGSEDQDAQDADDKQYSVVVALRMRDVLRLEMAQKIGDVNIVPADLEKSYLSIRSSDLLETQFGVRELRGID